nr:immunoglobulin light chain junction region [Macaca mulatta]MOW64843.1 immunoglobulin light chain junction region [Macaca mulatta]MOW72831.1 immunoglobulin light chain junction region [Macaca mulatta]MOW72949.1 immunoglobulin light chain junction region [Macaca mulatta]MOW73164.1 immunoglobulin light chain junction region [Macaca mulatta]
CGQGAHLPPTF